MRFYFLVFGVINVAVSGSFRENISWCCCHTQKLMMMICYEGPAKSFVTGFGLLQCYGLSNIFLLQTFKVVPLY